MRPLDPRLIRWASATRRFLIASVLLAVVTSILIIIQAWALADAISAVFLGGAALDDIANDVLVLAAVVVARSLIAYGLESLAFHSAAKAKSQLRMAVLDHAVALGPQFLTEQRAGDLSQLTTRGIDALDAYFARYLPQLVLAVIIPITIGAAILTQDLLATIIIALTLPLIPLFMILVGLYTQKEIDKQWRSLGQLAGHFLDVVAGLPTLKVFGRAKAQAATLREVGSHYRRDTMRVLRVSFISSLVLELLATISVAIVAVSIGLRLVSGDMDLRTALIVLLLAPEAYLPMRLVGTHYHAAADGIAASGRLLDILDQPIDLRDSSGKSDLGPPVVPGSDIELTNLTARYPERPVAAIDNLTYTIEAGQITAVVGPSGAGKSTLLQVILGFFEPPRDADAAVERPDVTADELTSGCGTAELVNGNRRWLISELNRRQYLDQVAWLPQTPVLIEGTVAQNVLLGRPNASDDELAEALIAAGLAENHVDASSWLVRLVGEGGRGLSAGQQRRVALARVAVRAAPLVLLDEPSAALDPATESLVVDLIRAMKARGSTVVVVAHRPALVEMADNVLELRAPEHPGSQIEITEAEVLAALPGLRS